MNLLLAVLFSRAIRVNPKRTARKMKKNIKFLVKVVKELAELLQVIILFIYRVIMKLCTVHTDKVVIVKDDTVINLSEYKLKKAAINEKTEEEII